MINLKNKRRCIFALVLCCLVIISGFIAVFYRITNKAQDDIYSGLQVFRYWTYLTNLIAALATLLCIPYQIDGLRNNNYHLPRWIVHTLFIAVCTVALTLIVCLFLFIPTVGLADAFLDMPLPFAHFLTPLLSIITFIFINDDHKISFKVTLYALIPCIIYMVIYTYEVFILGNWLDHYRANDYLPFGLFYLVLFIVYFLLSNCLRLLHNKRHNLRKREIEEYYTCLSNPTIESAIEELASQAKHIEENSDIIIPKRILKLMEEQYHSGKSLDELCNIYIKNYLK